MSKPELLAPAGDYNSAVAAVEAGADAVYFGGKEFSARNFAVNLTREEIKKAVDYAHLRGVKCYAAVNTLIKDIEFAKLYDYINFLYAEGIEALIIQDLDVLNMSRKYWPDLALHASTQMSAHNLRDVLELEKLGFKRVVLARELTLEEILDIKNNSRIELECFAHGALCFSYSGQCYMSSMIGGRSGNRGRCAQPCRKKYNLAERQTGKILDRSGYLMSARDLCALDILDKLNFVDSLKIEGRMKGAAYVGGTVEKYRKHIDSLARKEKTSDSEIQADKKEMAMIFNRGGFSHGYLLEKKPADLIAIERSKNFGVKVGEVAEVKNGRAKLKVKEVNVNDGLEIWGRGGQEMNFGFRVEKISNGVIEIWPEKGADIKIGDAVHKNFDYALNKKLNLLSQENYQRRVPVQLEFRAEEGKNIVLKINGAKAVGKIAQKARQRATAPEAIKAQLAKLGGTVFTADTDKIKVDIKGGLNIPLKDLNAVRREAVLKLEKEIINSFKRKKKAEALSYLSLRGADEVIPAADSPKADNLEFIALSAGLPRPAAAGLAMTNEIEKFNRQITVQSNDSAVLDGLLNKKISRIYTALKIDTEKFHKNNIDIFQALPRIWRKGEKLEVFTNYDGFLVPALGYLEILPKKAKKIGDFSLNIFNSFGVRQLEKMGCTGFTASIENTLVETNDLATGKMEKEAIVYGYLPLMIAEYCVLLGTVFCGQKKLGIMDEKKIIFPILADCANCRMQLLNSCPLYFTEIEKLETDSITDFPYLS